MADVDKLVIAGEIGRQTALEYIEYTFEPGVMYALSGRNGAGNQRCYLLSQGSWNPCLARSRLAGRRPGT